MTIGSTSAIQPIRLVIAEVDGTLITKDKVLAARAVAAVNHLRQAGVAVTITSGRPPLGMKMLIDPLRISEPIAALRAAFVRPDFFVNP